MNSNKLVSINFHFSVWVSILGAIAVLNYPDVIVPDADGLYGPLRNNLLIAVGYLLVGQLGLWYLRYLRGSRFEAILMAYTFLATAAGAKFFGEVNGLPVSNVFIGVLLYCAFSHGLYYFFGRAGGETQASQRL